MKKIYLILVSLAAIGLSACSTEDSSTSETGSGSISMQGTLNDTRVTETDAGSGFTVSSSTTPNAGSMKTSWASGDLMTVVYDPYNEGTTTSSSTWLAQDFQTSGSTNAGNGFFQSTSSGLTVAQVKGYIDNSAIAMSKSSKITVSQVGTGKSISGTVDLTGQDGTLSNVSNYDLLYASSTQNGVGQKPFVFNHAMCVLRFDLYNLHTTISSATITYTPNSSTPQLLASSVAYSYDGSTLTQTSLTNTSSITVSNSLSVNSSYTASVYIVIPGTAASSSTTYSGKFAITVTDNNGLTYKTSNVTVSNITFNYGKVYAKSVDLLGVGMYYYADGQWGWQTTNPRDNGSAAIGLVISTSPGSAAQADGHTNGVAIALNDASDESSTYTYWSSSYSTPSGVGSYPFPTDTNIPGSWAGLQDMNSGYVGGVTDRSITSVISNGYYAYYYAAHYNVTVATPSTSSKWYLPSAGEWYNMYSAFKLFIAPWYYHSDVDYTYTNLFVQRNEINYSDFCNYFTAAGGTVHTGGAAYMTATEINGQYYFKPSFNNSNWNQSFTGYGLSFEPGDKKTTAPQVVRAMLSF